MLHVQVASFRAVQEHCYSVPRELLEKNLSTRLQLMVRYLEKNPLSFYAFTTVQWLFGNQRLERLAMGRCRRRYRCFFRVISYPV